MVGIFDSGIGGVTVLKEIYKLLPKQDYVYYSDSLNNPYGEKDIEDLRKIVNKVVQYLISKNCNTIVIACNTASAICVKYLREQYENITFIAIEPAYKMVYDNNYKGKTLIMATKGTIESEKFKELFNKYDNNNTEMVICNGLAELIEKNHTDLIEKYLKNTISIYKDIENVVLGCTHYPLIKEKIKEVLGDINLYDGSIGVSNELKRRLEANHQLNKGTGTIIFTDSSNDLTKEKRFFDILNNKN